MRSNLVFWAPVQDQVNVTRIRNPKSIFIKPNFLLFKVLFRRIHLQILWVYSGKEGGDFLTLIISGRGGGAN